MQEQEQERPAQSISEKCSYEERERSRSSRAVKGGLMNVCGFYFPKFLQ